MKKSNKRKFSKRRKKLKRNKKSTPVLRFLNENEHFKFSALGANYLLSDYDEGIWNPLFDLNDLLSLKEQSEFLANSRGLNEENGFNMKSLVACAWIMLPSEIKKSVQDQLILKFGKENLMSDKNNEGWEFFHGFGKTILDNINSESIT